MLSCLPRIGRGRWARKWGAWIGLHAVMTNSFFLSYRGLTAVSREQHKIQLIILQIMLNLGPVYTVIVVEKNLDKKLLDILACPLCKSRLIFDPKQQELICRIDKLAYPICEDIPVMLVDEARRLTDVEVV